MNEELPPHPERALTPSNPGTPLTPTSHEPMFFWVMVVLGVLLLVFCCFLCALFRGPIPLFFGGFVALASLIGRGYRGFFVGYVTPIVLVFLLFIAICGHR